MTAVYQFLPSYVARTAIGIHTREVSRLLRAMGIDTHAYVVEARGVPDREVSPLRAFSGRPADGDPWLLYQLSTGSPMADFLAARREPLIVNYHNITPASFFQPWEPLVAPEMSQGRAQMCRLASRTSLGIAVSAFNEAELLANGYQSTTVAPVLVDFEELGVNEDRGTSTQLASDKRHGGSDWIFVGRIAPNKRQDRLIRAFAVYRRVYDRNARLRLVGGSSSHAYLQALVAYARRLGLGEAVTITGSLPQKALVSYYRHADVFVCLSEHEGFCVPVLEAMWHGIPVVALGAAAVPETVGDAALVLPMRQGRQPEAAVVAAAVHRIMSDGTLRDRFVAAGTKRVECFSLPATSVRMRDSIAGLVGAA